MLVSSRLRAILTSATVVVAGLAVVGIAPAAHAAGTATWTGASSDLWSDPDNWGGVAPMVGDDLLLPAGATQKVVINDLLPTEFQSLTIAGPGYEVLGDPVQVMTGLSTSYSSGTSSVNADLSIFNGSVNVAPGGTLALGGYVVTSGALMLAGGGTLQVDGTLARPVVLAGGTLSGSGTLTGAGITTTAASTLSPGPAGGPGMLRYAANTGFTLSSSTTFHVDIDGSTLGTGYDQLKLTSGSALFNPNGATLEVDLGYVPAINTSFQIVSQTFGSPITGRFNGISQFGTYVSRGVTFAVGYFNSGIILTVTDVDIPTASVVVDDSDLRAGETSDVTITFNEAVTGFDNADLTVNNGTLSEVSSGDGGVTWTATLTPTASTTDATNVITLDNTGVTNAAGNTGAGSTDSNTYAIDTVRPTASVVVDDSDLLAGETSDVTITFSEAVSGFGAADLTVNNGTLSGLSTTDNITWTATLTPTASTTDATNVITLDNTGVTNAAGNAGAGSTDSNNYAVSTVRPTASVVVDDSDLLAGETSDVTITFSEAVSGFGAADLTVNNGTLSGLSTTDNITWTATLTPTASTTDATNVITLDNTGVTNAAGNAGAGSTDSNNYAVSTVRPTASVVVDDSDLLAGETSDVTITFSEAVSGLDSADLDVANGSLSTPTTSDGGITWTATLTPAASTTDATNVIALDNTGVVNAAGNTGSGTTDSNSYAVSTIRPTAGIVVTDTALLAGETSLVTITFSEAVTGFGAADLTVNNGTFSALSTSDNITWTATLTPAASTSDATNVITLANTGVTNAAGNTGTGSTDSNNYAVSTIRPTASVVVANNSLSIGETSLVTITFSEAVTGFAAADLTVENGTLSGLATSDNITYTATLTPSTSTTDATNVITLANTGVTNGAGNTGAGSTDSNNYAIDNVRPTAAIVVTGTDLLAGETSLVTITFSEAVTGFDNSDLSVANGTLTALSTADNITWTATFTPSGGTIDSSNLITMAVTGVTDSAGNSGIGTSNSNNYTIDTVRPTASIVVSDSDLGVGETSGVTITFSEAVSGFDNTDLTIENGTLTSVSSSDGGITWTATLTPTASTTDSANVITLGMSGVENAAGNAGTGTTSSNNYAIATALPLPQDAVAPNSEAAGPAYSSVHAWSITYTASDAGSGVASVDLYVQAPGETTYAKVATDTANQDGEFSYTGTADGIYRFRTIATDVAGNVEPAPGSADSSTVLDTHAPSSQGAGPSLINTDTWTITYTSSDAGSGVASVDLYVQAPGETTYVKVATNTADQDGEFSYTATADGTYRFRTIATDRAGNVEATPADVITTLDTHAPRLRAAMGHGPVRFDLSEDRSLALRFHVDEAVSTTFRITKHGAPVRTFGTRTSAAGIMNQLWRGGLDDGSRVRPGRYRIVVIAQDPAGNEARTSVPLRVTR